MKLSSQESKILELLCSKPEVYWEELAQFCKNPMTVKLKTVKKIVSDLKKKFKIDNIPVPFNCSISEMSKISKFVQTNEHVDFNGQKLVQVKRNELRPSNQTNNQLEQTKQVISTPIPIFAIKPYANQVITKSGIYTLNLEELELFKYFHSNIGRFISLEELRDKVCFPKFGSKLPSRWFFSIQRRVANIRHQIPETKNALLTAKQQNTSGYIFNTI